MSGGSGEQLQQFWQRLRHGWNERIRSLPFFSRRREGSLVANVLFLHLLWGVFVYLMAVVGLWWISNNVLESSFQDQARRWIETADEMGTPLYVSRDESQFDAIAEQVVGFKELGYLRFYDVDGRTVLGEFQRPETTEDLSLQALKPWEIAAVTYQPGKRLIEIDNASFAEQHVMRAFAPVWVRSIQSDGLLEFELNGGVDEEVKLIGFIDLGLDFSHHRANLARNILRGSLVIALVFAALLIVGRIYLHRTLKPLEELQAPLARLAMGDMRVKVKGAQVREVNAISEALNTTINAIRERDKELRELANHDSLTKLVNRHYFTDQVISELLTIDEVPHNSALFFLDLDEFKAINDVLGHDAGDKLLIQVAEILKNRVREYDVVSRFGGDEFVILVIGVTRQDAQRMGESILDLMRGFHYTEEGRSFNVYCSIGITMIESSQYTVDQLLKQADSACQKAKQEGRNQLHFYEPNEIVKQQLIEDSGWSERLSNALASDGFVLYYQPIVSAEQELGEFYEVLVRMKDNNGGLISPRAFMGAAERFGLSREITYWVVEHALLQLAEFQRVGRNMAFSINLAGSVLEDDEFISFVQEKVRASGVTTKNLMFEIPEVYLLGCKEKALRTVATLRGLDCRIAIDGFGAGLNASGRLKAITFDYLKIGRELMDDLANNPINQTLVKAAVELARVMEKKVVAGYIQDEQTLATLERLNVDFVQGYYLGEPDLEPVSPNKFH